MNEVKNLGDDEIALWVLKLVIGGQAAEPGAELVPGPKLTEQADLRAELIATGRTQKGF